jgi:hypothetical protein
MPSSDGNDNDSNNSTNSIKDQNKTSVVELLDDLISHMNTTRSLFKVMILSSFILAPLSLMLAAVFVIHPFFINRILFRIPDVGFFLLFFIGVSITLASMWLYIGLMNKDSFLTGTRSLLDTRH